MNGMQLSRQYYEMYCLPMLADRFPGLAGRLAAGLVGEGSECFGFDDAISRDHDWGAAVCFWLTEEDYRAVGTELQAALDELAGRAAEKLPMRKESPMAAGRSGVMEIGAFYFRHIGLKTRPDSLIDWLRLPEDRLATVTNGAVFADPLGLFSGMRNALSAFYPEDVRRKKLAARLSMMAQTGQYNLGRSFKRGESVAALLAEAQFATNAMSAVFLLNRRYAPFYKWTHRALRQLPVLGPATARLLENLVAAGPAAKEALVEEVCRLVVGELNRQGLSDKRNDFLLEQALEVQNGIKDETIRALSVFIG